MTDRVINLVVAGQNISLNPSQVKFSWTVDCPWRPQLEYLVGASPSDPMYLRTRQHKAQFEVEFAATSLFTNYPIPLVYVDDSSLFWEWIDYSEYQCGKTQMNATEFPYSGRTLLPSFNYTRTAGLLFSNERLELSFLFLPWAWSDDRQYTRASAKVETENLVWRPEEMYFAMRGNTTFEFLNSVEYDPTLQFLFIGQESVPVGAGASPLAAINDAVLSGTALAAAIAVPIVVVVIVAVVLVGFVVNSRRRSEGRARLVRKLDGTRGEATTPAGATPHAVLAGAAAGAAAEAVPEPPAWVRTNPKS